MELTVRFGDPDWSEAHAARNLFQTIDDLDCHHDEAFITCSRPFATHKIIMLDHPQPVHEVSKKVNRLAKTPILSQQGKLPCLKGRQEMNEGSILVLISLWTIVCYDKKAYTSFSDPIEEIVQAKHRYGHCFIFWSL